MAVILLTLVHDQSTHSSIVELGEIPPSAFLVSRHGDGRVLAAKPEAGEGRIGDQWNRGFSIASEQAFIVSS